MLSCWCSQHAITSRHLPSRTKTSSDFTMKDNKQQIARIRKMERRLNSATAAVKRLEAALDNWEAAQEAIAALDEYYGSDLWRQDFADDEAGLLPADLKRGVLSEDGIWNLITDVNELNDRLKQLSPKKYS